jgi:hypothetical protein
MPPKIYRQPQFDIETGSVLSGIYEEPEPSLIYSARGLFLLFPNEVRILITRLGVDLVKRPLEFARSYPRDNLELDRAALYSPEYIAQSIEHVRQWLSSSIASTPQVFNSVSI